MKKYPKFLTKCKNCDKDVFAKNSSFDKPNRQFCDKSCFRSYKNKIDNPSKRDEVKIKISEGGKKRNLEYLKNPETILKRSKTISGENHHNWQGGKTSYLRKMRNSQEMKEWKKKVLKRDNYKCIFCKSREKLNVDHIIPFCIVYNTEKVFDISNGRTLCLKCHIKTDTFGVKANKHKK